ncbi:MAG: UDP-N-acetylmuramoyl-L-alanyl-D-glutamate--2,6-diaminopimelate ligase [Sideroxydans sp.]|nr:UDP-N-acetylmuramoyl-L-alanyl-D-glutamate--2,6-diaminopimelate ligase [Sideroxydans sp.]
MSPTSKHVTTFRPELLDALGVAVVRLVTDSRLVQPGDTFVAYPGEQADGRRFIEQAIANGANAVIWEAHGFSWEAAWGVPNLAVRDLRHHAGAIADHVYGAPSRQLWMVGVTGTNGKTSCSHWIAQSLSALGRQAALVGTLGNGFPPDLQPTLNTTPDAIRLHGLLAEYRQQGAQAVVMEVSSHALAQGRVNAVEYDVALLTNLSRDHLDYHGDMDRYASAKRRLFDWQQLRYAVLNLDDMFGNELAVQLQDKELEVIGYGLTGAALELAERLGVRMVHGSALRMDGDGLELQLHTSWGGATLRSGLIGRFNASNLLGALAVLLVGDAALADAVRELGRVRAVPGRMQAFGGGSSPTVVVDYAHTPDALEKVLQALREVATAGGGKLTCVFGCGGDRDRGKRPMMGSVAAKLADACIVTSDNPRNEEPGDIIAAIVAGMDLQTCRIIEDREQAIMHAVSRAHAADTVLVAGKGHEEYQEIRGVKYPFSDGEIVQRALRNWAGEVRS